VKCCCVENVQALENDFYPLEDRHSLETKGVNFATERKGPSKLSLLEQNMCNIDLGNRLSNCGKHFSTEHPLGSMNVLPQFQSNLHNI